MNKPNNITQVIIEREYVFPDLIKYHDHNGVVATAHRSWMDKAIQEYFKSVGYKVVPHALNGTGGHSE
jgi:hypothetical protein